MQRQGTPLAHGVDRRVSMRRRNVPWRFGDLETAWPEEVRWRLVQTAEMRIGGVAGGRGMGPRDNHMHH